MQLEAITPAAPVSLGAIERARDSMNAAYNAIAVDRVDDTLARDTGTATGYLHEARTHLQTCVAHAASTDARAAARAALPRLDHALQLLATLAVAPDPDHLTPLLSELGTAMDHIEAVLAGAGWD